MSLSLKKLGYSDVVVLEKSGRVGGKSYDIKYRDVEYSLGTSFLEPDYFEDVVPLAAPAGLALQTLTILEYQKQPGQLEDS